MLCSMGCILYEVVVQCGFHNDRSKVQKTFYISVISIISLASHAGVFRGVRFSSLLTNACSTENNIPFPLFYLRGNQQL